MTPEQAHAEIERLTARAAAAEQALAAVTAERDCARFEWDMTTKRCLDSESRLRLALAAGRRVAAYALDYKIHFEACERQRLGLLKRAKDAEARVAALAEVLRDLTATQRCYCGVTVAVGTLPKGAQFSDGCLTCPWCGNAVAGVPKPIPLPVAPLPATTNALRERVAALEGALRATVADLESMYVGWPSVEQARAALTPPPSPTGEEPKR